MLLKIVCEKILAELPPGKNNDIREAFQTTLERLKSVKTSGGDDDTSGQDKESGKRVNADLFWAPFKLACETGTPKIVETTLDCIQKLIAHKLLRGSLYDHKTNSLLINEIVDVVCTCFVSAKTDPAVQLQIIKVLLTAITAPSCEVHETALLKAVQTCFNLFLFSKSSVNQVTAKAALTQIVNLVFQRLEKFSVAVVAASETQQNQKQSNTNDDVKLDTLETTEGGDDVENEQGNGPDTTTIVVPAPSNVNGDGQPGKYGFCIVCHKKADHYCSQTKDPVCSKECKQINLERIEAEERRRKDDVAAIAAEAAIPDTLEPTSAADKKSEFLNPYDPTVSLYAKILRKDVFLLFRRLCLLSKSPDDNNQMLDQNSNELRGRILALELLLSVLTNPGPVFRTNEVFVSLVKKDLCLPLSKNGISPNPSLFELSLSIFLMLLSYFKAPLKSEIQVLFTDIFLRILKTPSTYQQKSMVMQALSKVCSNPQTIVDIYLNYDCDVNGDDLFEAMVVAISDVTQQLKQTESTSTDPLVLAEIRKIRLRGLQSLVAVVRSLVQWGTHRDESNEQSPQLTQTDENAGPDGKNPTLSASGLGLKPVIPDKNPLSSVALPNSISSMTLNLVATNAEARSDSPETFQEMKTRKTLLRQGIEKFNTEKKAKKGLKFLLDNGFFTDDPKEIASFLLTTPGLNKTAIGELLGEEDQMYIKIMHAFIDIFDFKGLDFTRALRHFLQSFRLPGESQKIDRLMEKFADRYCETNPDVFANADTAYTLAFSVIMLNTDLHSNQVKHKMTKVQFLRNNRGINNGGNLEDSYLEAIYDDIAKEEIVMEEEQTAELHKAAAAGESLSSKQLNELHRMQVGQLTRKLQALLRAPMPSELVYHSGSHTEHVRPMFECAWMPIMATFSILFEESTEADTDLVKLCLDGFSYAINIACQNQLEIEREDERESEKEAKPKVDKREAFVQSLFKFTVLSNIAEMKSKNIAAIHTLLAVAYQNRNELHKSWEHVLSCISRLERLQLIGQGSSSEDDSMSRTPPRQPGDEKQPAYDEEEDDSLNLIFLKRNHSRAAGATMQQQQPDAQTKSRIDVIVREFQSQTIVLAIDRIFSSSAGLTGQSIVHFFRCLCTVSLEEVDLTPKPRVYSLQKIIELAYYNIDRIRLEWSPIWQVLQPYFNTVSCHANPTVATMAVDSVRQLALKFLERDELARYHTQGEFLKPLEYIMKNSRSKNIKEYALKSLEQMIRSRAGNIKSGWKSIFVIYSRAASEKSKEMVAQAFSMLAAIFTNFFEHAGGSFVDFVSCLVEFAFNSVSEEIAMGAIHLLQSCAAQLTMAAAIPAEIPQPSEEELAQAVALVSADATPTSPSLAMLAAAPNALGQLTMDEFFLRWFPILSGLSKIIIDCQALSVRKKALETVFLLLRSSGRSYTLEYWRSVFRSVLHPIFEDLKDPETKKNEVPSTIWIQALRSEVELFVAFFPMLSAKNILESHLELLMTFMVQKNENLAKTGAICLNQLISKTLKLFSPSDWKIMTDTLESAFNQTTPNELLSPSRELDFPRALAKVAVHLELIKSVKEIGLSQSAGTITVIPKDSWSRWLKCLHNSYRFARSFNSNYDLRLSLMTAGFVAKIPNLNQQETVAIAAYLLFSFRLYQHYGGNGEFPDNVLFAECKAFLEIFAALLAEPKKNERDIAARSHIVVIIFEEITSLNWEDVPTNKTRGVRDHVAEFFRLCSQLVVVEVFTIRKTLQAFLSRVGTHFLPASPATTEDALEEAQ